MDKRLEKRHKRQVARAKMKVKVSEPDVRTEEQIQAAREASRSEGGKPQGTNVKTPVSSRSLRNNSAASTGSAARTAS